MCAKKARIKNPKQLLGPLILCVPKSSCAKKTQTNQRPLAKCFLDLKDKSHEGKTASHLPAKAKLKLHREPLIHIRSDPLVLASSNFCGVPCSSHKSNLKRKLEVL